MHVKLSCQFNIYAFDVNFKCLMVPAYVTTGQLREFAETGAKVPFVRYDIAFHTLFTWSQTTPLVNSKTKKQNKSGPKKIEKIYIDLLYTR